MYPCFRLGGRSYGNQAEMALGSFICFRELVAARLRAGVSWSDGLSFWSPYGWLPLISGRRNLPRLTIRPPSRLRGSLARSPSSIFR